LEAYARRRGVGMGCAYLIRMKNKIKLDIFNLESLEGLEKMNTMYYIVGMVILWNDKKADSNLKKHGVAFEEAEKYEERI